MKKGDACQASPKILLGFELNYFFKESTLACDAESIVSVFAEAVESIESTDAEEAESIESVVELPVFPD